MFRCGRRLIDAGVQHFPAQLIFHGGVQNDRHVPNSAVVGFVVQPHAVCKMGGLRNAQLLCLFVHQLYKGLVGPGDINGQGQGCVGAGGEDGAIQQLPDCG